MNITQIYQIINNLLGDRAAELNQHISNSLPNPADFINAELLIRFDIVEANIKLSLANMGCEPAVANNLINQIMLIGDITGPDTTIFLN